MDYTRWDTGQVLAAGVTNRRTPDTDIPEVNLHDCNIDDLDPDKLQALVAAGHVLGLLEYYGCVYAWTDNLGHHGRLMQYRNLTESPEFTDPAALVEWFISTGHAVAG